MAPRYHAQALRLLKHHLPAQVTQLALLPCSALALAQPLGQVRRYAARAGASSINKFIFEAQQEQSLQPSATSPASAIQPPPPSLKLLEQTETGLVVLLDGARITLPYTFLRDSCRCPKCKDPSTSQKTFNTGDLVTELRPAAVRAHKHMLELIWPGSQAHRTTHSSTFLAAHQDRQALTRTRHNDRSPVLWNAQEMQARMAEVTVPFKKFKEDEGTVAQVVHALEQVGLAFVKGCPAGHAQSEQAQHELATLATRIGPLKRTFYGETWDVQSKAEAKNVAYTSVDLDLHMDLLYFESPPGLQFLYCLENEVEGGTSVFVDSFRAAEEMRTHWPEHFKTLCTYEVDYEYRNDGYWYHYSRPTFIVAKETGKMEYVNYSPPFQGTLNPEGFEPYQAAIAVFADLLAKPENRLERLLEEGTCVIFNNRRTLHARRSFGPGRRWLKGTYVDIDALWSKDRVYKSW